MTNRESNKEKFLYWNNLTSVVKGLENQCTTIDLRNESCVTGKIKYVDGFMNVDMENVVYYDPMGNPHAFDCFFIHARLIRFVHIPKHLPSNAILESQIKSYKRPVRTKPKDNNKVRRAKQYHQETVKNITSTNNQVK